MFNSYIKTAIRHIIRHKAYALINVFGLAIGIACCLVIMLYVQDELSYDRYHANADRIYRVAADYEDDSGVRMFARTAPLLGPTLEQDFPEVEHAVRFARFLSVVANGDKQFYEDDGFFFADRSVFDVFSFGLMNGDIQTALNEPYSIVLTEDVAKIYFGDADPVGKTLTIRDEFEFKVTGILSPITDPSTFHITMLASFSSLDQIRGADQMNTWSNNTYYTYILLREGVDRAQFEAKLPAFITRHVPPSNPDVTYRLPLEPLTDIHLYSDRQHDFHTGGDIGSVYFFSAIAFFTLVVACINFMNLATARAAKRAKEVGLRKTVGAYRTQLIGQFMGESILLAVIALWGAVALTQFTLPLFNDLFDKSLQLTGLMSDYTVLIPIGITLFAGILGGSYPAMYLSGFRPATALKGRTILSRTGRYIRQGLVICQFTVSIALIAGTDIANTQWNHLRTADLGFEKEQIVVSQFYWDAMVQERYETVKAELMKVPSVVGVTASGDIPGRIFTSLTYSAQKEDGMKNGGITALLVDPDFVETYRARLLAGRDFSYDFSEDTEGRTFVLNESAVRMIGWTDPQEAIGKSFKLGANSGQVVGVVTDFHVTSLEEEIKPLAMGVWPSWFGYVSIRITPDNMPATLASLETAWQSVFPTRPFAYFFLDDDLNRQYQSEQQLGRIFGLFSGMAIIIACLGLLGLIAFTAEQRTREIGVRKVLGATNSSIFRMLTWDFLRPVLAANLLAAPLAYFVMRSWLSGFATRVDMGVSPFLIGGLGALVVALLTVGYQAVKATRTTPARALQYE